MNRRVLGYVLVATSLVLGGLAFANARYWNPRVGFLTNLRQAVVAEIGRARSTSPAVTCPEPVPGALREIIPSCTPRPAWSMEVPRFTLTLGNGLVVTSILGLVGVGLIVFGRSKHGRPIS